MNKKKLPVQIVLGLFLPVSGLAQQNTPDFTGMWSDPPNTLEGTLCFFACFDGGLDTLYALIDDPLNDDTPVPQLVQQAMANGFIDNIVPKLSPKGKEQFPLDQSKDPSYTECIPWGFAREIFAPHQLRIEQHPDHLDMQYGEWNITRTVLMKANALSTLPAHSNMGFSVAHYEGDTLVIETSRVTENIFFSLTYHSDLLSAVERYSKSADGERLNVEVTFTDPLVLTEPVTAKKFWTWAPDQEIYAYDSCRIPDPNLIIEGV